MPLHPFLPIPRDEQRRLALVARLALAELHAGPTEQALTDLQAVAAVCRLLVAGSRYTDDDRQAVEAAAQALEAARANTITTADAIASAVALVGLFEQALRVTTLRRLHAAQDEAARVCGAD